jgi:hypothetical protein
MRFVPYYPELTLDLESTELTDRSIRDDVRRYSESSGQGTSNEQSSENNDVNRDLDSQFMWYENPVVPQPELHSWLMSTSGGCSNVAHPRRLQT